MRVLVTEGESVYADMTFARESVRVGSSKEAEVHLPDLRIGQEQAVLVPVGQHEWVIEPLDLGLATLLNGHVIHERRPLANGDEIHILDYRLSIYMDGDEAKAAPASGQSYSAVVFGPLLGKGSAVS